MDIGNKWRITSDSMCVTVSERKKHKKTGVVHYVPRWYYNNLGQALEGLIDRDIGGLETLEFVCNRIVELKNEIKLALQIKGEA